MSFVLGYNIIIYITSIHKKKKKRMNKERKKNKGKEKEKERNLPSRFHWSKTI